MPSNWPETLSYKTFSITHTPLSNQMQEYAFHEGYPAAKAKDDRQAKNIGQTPSTLDEC